MSVPAIERRAQPDTQRRDHAEKARRQLQRLRPQAREHLSDGAATAGCDKLRPQVLATSRACMLRDRRHHVMARGAHAKAVADEFLAHSVQEQRHADRLAERIAPLGAAPDFATDSLPRRSHAQHVDGHTLADMVREGIVAELIRIDSCRSFIALLGNQDPTTRRLLETILAAEEEQADKHGGQAPRAGRAASALQRLSGRHRAPPAA